MKIKIFGKWKKIEEDVACDLLLIDFCGRMDAPV